jgi:hypothetical protein
MVIAIYAFANGNPKLLAAPFDSTGTLIIMQESNAVMVLMLTTPMLTIVP